MSFATTSRILTACTACFLASAAFGQNLIVNGDFEAGNTGFVSDYSFTAGGNCCEGQYTVRQLPNTFNGAFVNPPPASPGSVRMMIVNGALTPNLRVWSQTVPVVPGRTYAISLSGCTAVVGGPAILAFRVNSTAIGVPLTLEDRTGIWTRLEATWTADAASATLVISDLNTSRFPNDFYIDNITMEEVVTPCAADFNQDGGVDGADVGAFFAAWEQGDAAADVNSDGGVDGSDVDAFFALWEAGGC